MMNIVVTHKKIKEKKKRTLFNFSSLTREQLEVKIKLIKIKRRRKILQLSNNKDHVDFNRSLITNYQERKSERQLNRVSSSNPLVKLRLALIPLRSSS